ncbi:putative glycosyl hydrolase [Actinoplanes missouriensis 431]|uniref:chitinase n=1 Tax=Actinoplanes missouriensis (strain ATCC 14538 / DSM 43046 / CBS 188.64 / JCM 3121 / NBRC 102363 / NCIMB 12654 / NRRL B-3342 / UNCC 431) TaxID=512565 RepID=I0H0L3_ACTM4|nr:glycoside hydrolase family 18 protein [Actinoplanes missouriensis]BAL86550.1 putative glycosyl hydrolase [Actinoplanes missouriensis 431]
MRGLSRRLVAVAAAAASVVAAAPSPAQAHTSSKKVAYFTQWGIYGRDFQLADVQTSGAAARLTHINYAFGPVTADGVCASADPWADWQTPFSAENSVDGVADVAGQPISGNLNQFAELKRKNPKLRVLISLGGWSGSAYFSDAALTDASRKKLVSSCIDLWIKGNLPGLTPGVAAGIIDGIDLDWEWPGSSGNAGNIIRPEDKQNFTLLAAEFRAQLDRLGRSARKHYELTAFVPAAPAKIEAGFEVNKVFKYLDFATVQGYDFHGTWEAVTNQQSALRVPAGAPDNPDFSVENTINAWIAGGAPKKKLVLGVPYYGQGWTGVSGGGDGLFQPATGPAPSVFGGGTEDYKTLKNLPAQGYTVHRDLRNGHAWLFDGTTFWTYDDPAVLLQKSLYIRAKGLGGAMMWSLDGDDSRASLTKAITAAL